MGAVSVDQGTRPVGVVVVTHNSADVIEGLLDTIEDGLAGCDWNLVLIDNASEDDTVGVVRRASPEATVIELPHNLGFAAGLNRGIKAVGREADLLTLNPDVRLSKSSALSLRQCFRGSGTRIADGQEMSGKAVGIAAPRLVGGGGAPLPSLRREPTIGRALAEAFFGVRRAGRWGWGEAVLDPGAYEGRTSADWVSGAALMISRECLDACGPWDESFFLYSEDTEYALRARENGYLTVLEPAAVAVHLGGESRSDPQLWSRLVLNKVALYRRRHGRAQTLGFRLAALLRELRLAATGNAASWTASRALVRGWSR
jgi:GT2 family glycosyltransferase